jgi:hypothetical protein
VCQIGSPRSIAVALQRIGRSGHQVEHTTKPKGRIFATTRDELIECAALTRSIASGDLDRLLVPSAPLDVLAQQIVAMAAVEDWAEDDLFKLARRAYCYADLTREDFDAVVEMLSEGSAPSAAEAARSSTETGCMASCAAVGVRGWRRLPRAARFPDSAQYLVLAEPDETSWARSTRISRWSRWPATCSCSARRRGGSAAWSPARRVEDARGRRPPSRSGAARRRPHRGAVRRGVAAARGDSRRATGPSRPEDF